MLKRITIKEAKARFSQGMHVVLCPCKIRPHGPFSMGTTVFGKEWMDKAEGYTNHPDLWKGSILSTAWALMYNNWLDYNSSYETGYYAHYYVEQ